MVMYPKDEKISEQRFSIVFYVGRHEVPRSVTQYCLIEVFERENLSVSFSSNTDNLYLYIDGLDGNDSSNLHLDGEGIPCLAPGTQQFPIYSDVNEDYPLIPGDYLIFVKGKQEVSTLLEATLRVRPNNITEDELNVMRNELNEMVQGLAYDQTRVGQGHKLIGEKGLLPPIVLVEYVLLTHIVEELGITLEDLTRRPDQYIKRHYREVRANFKSKQDDKSYRWLLSVQGQRANSAVNSLMQPNVILGAVDHLSYDTPENRMVLSFCHDVLSQLEFVLKAIRGTLNEEQRAIETRTPYILLQKSTNNEVRALKAKIAKLESMEKKIQKGIFLVRKYMEHPVLYGLKPLNSCNRLSLKIQRDWRYKKVFTWWKQLQTRDFQIPESHLIRVQWKRTDVLYEYWCYIKTIIALEQVGYTPISGWIFDRSYQPSQEFLYPVLQEGTFVEMVKDSIRLYVFYNEKMPRAKRGALNNKRLLYMEGTNYKPDIRIDIFRRYEYFGSIIIEAKYRKRLNIWNQDRVEEENRPKNMNTLQNYANSLKHIGDSSGVSKALKVIALHPSNGTEIDDIEDTNVCLIQLKPNEHVLHYMEYLKGLIEGK
ncbi:MAG: DUF2357 domain-containing protein [Bacillota bacterium]|nr:DUF2357 domain-containing protein [Bacillota bacterium]